MRAAAFLGTLAALSAMSAAAEPLPVRIADGAAWTMTVEHARDGIRAGKREAWSVTTITKLVWAKGRKDAGRLTVTPISTVPGPGSPAEMSAAAKLEVPIVFEVDDSMTPLRIVNLPEVRKAFEAMTEAMGAPATGPARDVIANLTDASINAMAAQDLMRFALAQGSDLEPGKEVTYEEDLPNPLGGPPIRSTGAVRLEERDEAAGRAIILWRQAFDPGSAAASMQVWLDRILKNVPPEKMAEARGALATAKLERNDSCRYEVDLSTGLVARAECKAGIVAGAASQVSHRNDTWVITQTLPEKR